MLLSDLRSGSFSVAARLCVALLMLLAVMPVYPALAAEPGTAAFQRTWERPDRPVADGQVSRTWMWGPEANSELMSEPYLDAPGEFRDVQYFDKARMEDNAYRGSAPWDVTNGLLVVELISGQMQLGDDMFEARSPATVNVAGDADDPTGPTYATFSDLLDAAPHALGEPIVARVDRAGTVTSDPGLAGMDVTAAMLDEITGHAIAAPFWEFMNSSGLVYQNGQIEHGQLFENAYFATGRPIVEAYWAEVKVAGTYHDVLMQCFERRCLTYTPLNPEGWQVEAGNVGQHYYTWRHEMADDDVPAPTPPPPADDPTPPPPADEPAPPPPADEPAPPPPADEPAETTIYAYTSEVSDWDVPDVPRLVQVQGLAVDSRGVVYVANEWGSRIEMFSRDGAYLGAWGSFGGGPGEFSYPEDVQVDAAGRVYVADTGNNRIQVFTHDGVFLRQWGSNGSGDGQFRIPGALAIDSGGSVYVADRANHRVQKFNSEGAYLRQWGSNGSGNGQFSTPYAIAVDPQGNVFVTDYIDIGRVQKFTSEGVYLTQWEVLGGVTSIAIDAAGSVYGSVIDGGGGGSVARFSEDGELLLQWGPNEDPAAQVGSAQSVAVDGDGVVYLGFTSGHVQKFSDSGQYLGGWTGIESRLESPSGAGVDAGGNLYVADSGHHRVVKFDASGTFETMWGLQGSAAGEFQSPADIVTSGGYIYVTDSGNNRVQRFTGAGVLVSQWGSEGTAPGQFRAPHGIAADTAGNIYVVDKDNHRVQKFDAVGGHLASWGGLGDGEGRFRFPMGIAVHGDTVYVTDTTQQRVQAFTLDGAFLGEFGAYGAGDGEFMVPIGIAVNPAGQILVVDQANQRVQQFAPDGTYLAQWGRTGDLDGDFRIPSGITVDDEGNLYIVDEGNGRIAIFAPEN